MTTRDELMAKLEAVGEEAVRDRYNTGGYGENRPVVQEWLRKHEVARTAESNARAEARAEESLSISRESLKNSKFASRISVIALVLGIILGFLKVLEWLSKPGSP